MIGSPLPRSLLRIVDLDSTAGRRSLARLAARAAEVIDRRVRREAERLIADVRRRGDAALVEAVARLDGVAPATAAAIRLPVPDPEAIRPLLPPGFASALDRAIAAVARFHRAQLPPPVIRDEVEGVVCEEVRRPLARVGVYVPGGRAAYPSTAVMTVVPAQVAGVGEIAVATPPAAWAATPALRFTLGRLGVREVWGMGGAHAVAAFAYGTETVPRVDAIVGPGNAWVTAAKRAVAGDVAIDGLAGPTEVVVVADGCGPAGGDAEWIAADLLAQAEHDPRAAAVLVTPDRGLARAVRRALATQLAGLTTAETAAAALARFGHCFLVGAVAEALALVEALAPEHLQLVGPRAEALAGQVRSAGAIFLGAATSEVFGDYLAGPSHVLPTGGSARFASGLGVEDFLRRHHRVRLTPEAAAARAADAVALALAEGLPAHAAAAALRAVG